MIKVRESTSIVVMFRECEMAECESFNFTHSLALFNEKEIIGNDQKDDSALIGIREIHRRILHDSD